MGSICCSNAFGIRRMQVRRSVDFRPGHLLRGGREIVFVRIIRPVCIVSRAFGDIAGRWNEFVDHRSGFSVAEAEEDLIQDAGSAENEEHDDDCYCRHEAVARATSVDGTWTTSATHEALQPGRHEEDDANRYERDHLQEERYEVVYRLQDHAYQVLQHQYHGHEDPDQHLYTAYYGLQHRVRCATHLGVVVSPVYLQK